MIKLRKYVYKFWLPILLCIACVFVQSQSELALPDYMSDIVTNGIQSSGIDSGVSEVLSEDTYHHLLLFLDVEDKNIVECCYQYHEGTIDDFPLFEKGYVLIDLEDEQYDRLSSIMIKPMLSISMIESLDESSEQYQQLFQGHNPYDVIAALDEETKNEMTSMIDEQIQTMGESTLSIAISNRVKEEYISLGGNVNKISNQYIIDTGITMLTIALLGSVAAMLGAYLSSKVGAAFSRDVRKAVFEKVEKFSHNEFNKFSTASLITRTTNDITQVQNLMVMMLRMVLFAPMMGIGALVKALNSSPSMTWIIILILVIIFGLIISIMVIVLPKFKIIQSLIDKLNLTMRENLSGILVIRAFGNEKVSEERFDQANNDLTKANLFVQRVMSFLMPLMTLIMNIATILVVWVGAKQIDLGNIAIGDMLAFIQYAMHIIMSFLFVAVIFIMIPRASVAAGRIHEVLSTKEEIEDPVIIHSFDDAKKGVVEFKNVSFKYPGAQEAVLSDINFIAEPGKTTAFIGSTGSGKSTLINLIPRLYDVSEGEVLINGVNVKNVKQHDLRELIGLVPQKGILFSGTIRSNLIYGNNDASDELIDQMITIAQAKEFIEEKELGLDEPIAQGGTNVSGGQKQRLCIARALIKNPDILIFDDSFSALDFKTDALLRQQLNELIKEINTTVLIVGQRIATIMDADQIIVLDNGMIVGKGTHKELLETCEVYQEIAYSQLSKEELENAA